MAQGLQSKNRLHFYKILCHITNEKKMAWLQRIYLWPNISESESKKSSKLIKILVEEKELRKFCTEKGWVGRYKVDACKEDHIYSIDYDDDDVKKHDQKAK